MKAMLFHQYGDIDVLRYEDVKTPEPGPTEAVVKVRATGMNFADLMVRAGSYRPNPGFPHILGVDIAGEVAEVGDDVSGWQRGQRVVIYASVGCRKCEPCAIGEINGCVDYRYFGSHLWGGYAEYVKVPAGNLVSLPASVSFEEAAAGNSSFVTAWHMLVTRAAIRPSEDVLVLAAASGIGVPAIQICKLMGCRVFACVGSDEKAARVRELGADFVINYTKQDFYEQVMALTHKRGVDVVFENTGKDTWDRSVRSLTRSGRLVTCGGTSGYEVTTSVAQIFHKQLTLLGSNHGPKRELERIVKMLEAGRLKPIVGRTLPLKDAREGHRILKDRENFGKLVLVPN